MPAGRRAVRLLGRLLVGAIVLLSAAGVGAGFVASRRLARERQQLRSLQLTSLEEIIPHVPAGRPNAADTYQRAFDLKNVSSEEQDRVLGQRPDASPETMAAARRVVHQNTAYYRLLDQASRIPECAFPVKWNAGSDLVLTHLASLRDASRMLQLRAIVLAADRDPDSSLQTCAVAFRMAEHVKREPTLISQLAAFAIESIAYKALEEALAHSRPSADACLMLETQLAAVDEVPGFVRAMQGECLLFGLPTFEEFRRKSRFGPYRIVLNLDQAFYLNLSRQAIELAPLPYRESHQRWRDLDAEIEDTPFPMMLTAMIMPSVSRGVAARDRAQAKLGLARVALLVSAFRANRGCLPDSLHEIEMPGRQLPVDPFSGRAFQFRKDASGVTLWSFGSDLDDDNGRPVDETAVASAPEEERRAIREDSDIVFHIPSRPSTRNTSAGPHP